jgi:rfaE bifunctional protein nucleotidyltransferase chain/domain
MGVLLPFHMSATGSCPKVGDEPGLVAVRDQARADGKTVVWTNGCFDLLHVGHVRNLQAARRLGDILVVGLNSDRSVRQLKGPERPINPERDRAEVLAALVCVDYVVVFDDPDPGRILAKVRPDVHCKGADYAPPHGNPIPEAGVIAAYGGRIEFLPLVPGKSTTSLVEQLRGVEGGGHADRG